jgi:hypothetical protein
LEFIEDKKGTLKRFARIEEKRGSSLQEENATVYKGIRELRKFIAL